MCPFPPPVSFVQTTWWSCRIFIVWCYSRSSDQYRSADLPLYVKWNSKIFSKNGRSYCSSVSRTIHENSRVCVCLNFSQYGFTVFCSCGCFTKFVRTVGGVSVLNVYFERGVPRVRYILKWSSFLLRNCVSCSYGTEWKRLHFNFHHITVVSYHHPSAPFMVVIATDLLTYLLTY
jgi:hypothetical protein